MLTIDLFEELEGPPEPNLIDALRDFLPIAVKHLKIKKLPKIKLLPDVDTEHLASFGKFSNEDRMVHVDINNRHPNDVLRTLAHELTHYAQGEQDRLDADSWQTGSSIEDEANAEAGVIMREFNQQFPQYMELKPIILPEAWSQKYKKSINCNNPKGFSQRAHCQGRKKANENFTDGEIKESKETRQALSDQHFEFPQQGQYGYRTGYQGRGVLEVADGRTGKIINLGEFGTFDDEYKPNQKWLRIVFTNPNMDDDAWNELEDMLWSDNQVSENFADGKGPGRPGDSQRHGIPKGATMAQLQKAAKSKGRRGQLARWQINMRRGRKK
jgi:hypothetical protein